MTTRARKISELPSTTTFGANDYFIVEKVAGSNTTTSKLLGSNMLKAVVQGPFANDSAANTAGVVVGQLYYTAAGDVKVRLT